MHLDVTICMKENEKHRRKEQLPACGKVYFFTKPIIVARALSSALSGRTSTTESDLRHAHTQVATKCGVIKTA